jgi:cytochrome c553
MKVLLAIAGLMIAAAAGMATGEENAAPSAQPDPSKGKEKAGQACAACHGVDGNSPIAQNPVLAGQGYDYLYKQLRNFKGEPTKDEARNNPVMSAMVSTLSDDDMRNLAAYFSSQQAAPRAATDKETIELGQKIYRGGIADREVPACAGCHGATGAGVPSQFPRLAGQYAQYTDVQLKAWRSADRANDPNQMMRMIAAKMTDREIAAVADYVAGLH